MPIIAQMPRGNLRMTAAEQLNVRLAFFGTPLFAVPSLRALHRAGWPIGLVVTAPDKPVGRRMLLTPSPVKTAAQELQLPVATPQKLDDEFFAQFTALKPDLCAVVAYGKLVPQRFLDVPRLGFVNVHPSLLPAYRGPSPIRSAILHGDSETGVSIMLLDAQMDHGPVLAQEHYAIPGGFDAPAVESDLAQLGARLLVSAIDGYAHGRITPQPQDDDVATVTQKFAREDGRLDFTRPVVEVYNRIRALAGNPGTWTRWDEQTLNILHAHPLTAPLARAPGMVFLQGKELAVACGDQALALETVQQEGSAAMAARDFLNGHQNIVGAVLH